MTTDAHRQGRRARRRVIINAIGKWVGIALLALVMCYTVYLLGYLLALIRDS